MKKGISLILAMSISISSLPQSAFASEKGTRFVLDPTYCNEYCLNGNFLDLKCYKKCFENISYVDNDVKSIDPKDSIFYEAKIALVKSLMQPFSWMLYYGMSQIAQKVSQLLVRKQVGKIEASADPLEAIKELDEGLSLIKGQEKAKRQMRSVVLGIVDQRSRCDDLEKGSKGATIIYMIGPTGSGKSYSAEILTKVLTGSKSKPFIIEASDVDTQSKKASPVDQLFGTRIQREEGREVCKQSPLVKQLASTPELVVIINEYDKMRTPELDEKLRTMADQGYIKVDGEIIDCSKATIIITSNESSSSIFGGKNSNDSTGSRTSVEHDVAFTGRLRVIEFEPLTEKDYEEIATPIFEALLKRYNEEYGVKINLGNTIKTVAEKVLKQNKGARTIFILRDNFKQTILDNIVLNSLSKEDCKNKMYNASYDKDLDEFILDEVEFK